MLMPAANDDVVAIEVVRRLYFADDAAMSLQDIDATKVLSPLFDQEANPGLLTRVWNRRVCYLWNSFLTTKRVLPKWPVSANIKPGQSVKNLLTLNRERIQGQQSLRERSHIEKFCTMCMRNNCLSHRKHMLSISVQLTSVQIPAKKAQRSPIGPDDDRR